MAEDADLEQVADVAALRREAASWRRKFREAESQIETLRQRDESGARREIERLAGDLLARPDDLLLAVNLDDLRADDGLLDADKAQAAITKVLEDRPHWRKPEPPPVEAAPGHPDVHAGPRPPEPTPLSFGQALRGARRAG